MAGFSGLVDGTHTFDIDTADGTGAGYTAAATTGAGIAELDSQEKAPPVSGLARVLMQKRGMFGHVGALGRNTIATLKRVQTNRQNQTLRGTFDYTKWKADPTDATANVYDVTVANLGDDINTPEDASRVGNATEANMAAVYDTTLNKHYVGDAAATGVTGGDLDGRNPT